MSGDGSGTGTGDGDASLFAEVGGGEFFDDLVDRFYAGVEGDALLRPLYPDDLAGSRRDLAEFLAQYWGGPPVYSMRKGHPRLRMRHVRFEITPAHADAWLTHMRAAIDAAAVDESVRARLLEHVEHAADFLINARH